MSEERAFVEEFDLVTRDHWANNGDYDRVNALLLHWKDDDLAVLPEVEKFQGLLTEQFRFKAHMYAIPSEDPGASLNFKLASFIKLYALPRRSLIIVYYAGHADDVDEDSVSGYSEWRAKKDGGPTLNWFMLQNALCLAKGDVLVVLDCCRAALRTRVETEGKMEVLAACGSDSRVPAPGRLSFTSVLIRQVQKRLKSGKEISIKWLHNHLFSDRLELGLTVSPVRFDLSKHDQPSIILKPLMAEGFTKKSKPVSSFMFLKVSLEEDPSGLQIANWIKSFPPKTIKGVDIEGLVLKARRLEGFKNQAELFPGSILGSLPPSAQSEILKRLWGLSHVITSSTAFASEASANPHPPNDASGLFFAESVLNNMQNAVEEVCDSVESRILLDPEIDLNAAAKDEVSKIVGAEDAITLRQYLLDNSRIPDKPEIPRNTIELVMNHRPGPKRFRYGKIDGKPVVVESFKYTTIEAGSSEPPPNTISQITRMVTQLSLPKRTSFHILPCVGYFREPHATKLSVVYALAEAHAIEDPPIALCDVYGSKLTKRVPLGLRIQLAYALATALKNFHRVGWVHKELKSGNIYFLHKDSKKMDEGPGPNNTLFEGIEFAQPWLFGFECSRPEDADTELKAEWKNNAYRHPERWGRPMTKFEKYHDVYALGIVLLEIAYWKPMAQFDEVKAERLDADIMCGQLLARAKKELPHRVGQNFADAIDMCLRFGELTEGLDELNKHQEYRARILDTLEKAAKSV